jgi:hypothetical protein
LDFVISGFWDFVISGFRDLGIPVIGAAPLLRDFARGS